LDVVRPTMKAPGARAERLDRHGALSLTCDGEGEARVGQVSRTSEPGINQPSGLRLVMGLAEPFLDVPGLEQRQARQRLPLLV